VKDGRVVKGVQFQQLRDAGDPVELAKHYTTARADELVFLDITASVEKRPIVYKLVERIAAEVFIPFTIGGGLNSTADIKEILQRGADKICLNTAAVRDPALISEAANSFGSQCVVIAIDVQRASPSSWQVYTHGGRRNTGLDALAWAAEVEARGAGEILLTSMDCDGGKNGFDVEITKQIATAVGIPVIASGGGGAYEHFGAVFNEGCADAALAASIFHFHEITIKDLKNYLDRQNVPVRH
jgi:cyclase